MEAATKPSTKRTPRPNKNPVEAGRAGGVASGAARRRKAEQQSRHWLAAMSDEIQEHPEQIARAVLRSSGGGRVDACADS